MLIYQQDWWALNNDKTELVVLARRSCSHLQIPELSQCKHADTSYVAFAYGFKIEARQSLLISQVWIYGFLQATRESTPLVSLWLVQDSLIVFWAVHDIWCRTMYRVHDSLSSQGTCLEVVNWWKSNVSRAFWWWAFMSCAKKPTQPQTCIRYMRVCMCIGLGACQDVTKAWESKQPKEGPYNIKMISVPVALTD